jgi:hypothetical protein
VEVIFKDEQLRCLNRRSCPLQEQEQTQEVKLPDSMPDIGSVLNCWGQVLLRSKEWHNDFVSISGGVMVWVLYKPEDGTEPRTVEGWLPFQCKWNLGALEREGVILAEPKIRIVDARSTSARKFIVRCSVGVGAEVLNQDNVHIYTPGELPKDVQLLHATYPLELPTEAGEKTFSMEEELSLPASQPSAVKLLYYSLRPEITDQRVLSDKVVFRGKAMLHILYQDVQGKLYSWDQDLPFSQFAELDRALGEEATADLTPVTTNLELELGEDGMLRMKAGLVAQYVVYDRRMVEVIQDAYSPRRKLELHTQMLQLPAVLERGHRSIRLEQSLEIYPSRVVDMGIWEDNLHFRRIADQITVELPYACQILFYDDSDKLQNAIARGSQEWNMEAGEDSGFSGSVTGIASPQILVNPEGATICTDTEVCILSVSQNGIPMVTGIDLGELEEPDPGRPSLLLRKAANDSLWELAKRCNSTVDAICRANGITQLPEGDPYLLIPVP